MFFKQVKNAITDFLFPPFCLCCKKPGEWWCEECRSGAQQLNSKICPKCLVVTSSEVHSCVGDLPFSSVFAFGYYHDPKLRPVITALKFNGTKAVLAELEKFAASHPRLKEVVGLLESSTIVPMPLADKRLRERGFNQAELIATTLCNSQLVTHNANLSEVTSYKLQVTEESKICTNLLFRVAHREPQSSLEHDLAKRQENIKNSFECKGPVPENIILIDDVATTGATAAEAARVLLDSGAKNVHLVCLAIGT